MNYSHQPVLLKEIINYLNCKKNGIYIDGTVGRGGHTAAILAQLGDDGLIIGFDRDQQAVTAAREKINDQRVNIVHNNFVNIPAILDKKAIKQVEGMIFDLGISSPQVDDPGRGFSYQQQGPLDMRMDSSQTLTAGKIVNSYTRKDLTTIIKKYGEERWASRIAKFIIKWRQNKRLETTQELVAVIKQAIPASARRSGGHPARRTFQALRIATNDELKQLEIMINKVVPYIKVGGRICIISFHSLEDRIVKHSFKNMAKKCVCPPDFPICACEHQQQLKIITGKPLQASREEIKKNSRARSAKLRVAEKVSVKKAGE